MLPAVKGDGGGPRCNWGANGGSFWLPAQVRRGCWTPEFVRAKEVGNHKKERTKGRHVDSCSLEGSGSPTGRVCAEGTPGKQRLWGSNGQGAVVRGASQATAEGPSECPHNKGSVLNTFQSRQRGDSFEWCHCF